MELLKFYLSIFFMVAGIIQMIFDILSFDNTDYNKAVFDIVD